MIERTDSDRHSTVLVATPPATVATATAARPGWAAEPVGFEQLVLAYLKRPPVGAAAVGTVGSSGTAVAS
ncbi:MAG: hypothetical protein ACRDNS_09260 [Trebonia sp.]